MCRGCHGSGYMALPDIEPGLTTKRYPSTPDEITLEGDASEVDYQQTPEDRARINAAAEQTERDNLERLRREAGREWLWAAIHWTLLWMFIGAAAVLILWMVRG